MATRKLSHLPVTLYGSVMGLVGLAIAFLRFEHIMKLHWGVGELLRHVASGWFVLLTLLYLLKAALAFGEVKAEFNHPIKINFFPAFSISLLLLSIAYLEIYPEISKILWLIGAPLHLAYTLIILNRWLGRGMKIEAMNPAWFIPVVGTILVPITGVNHAHPEISWFFFSVGIVFWGLLFAVLLYRLIFLPALPQKLWPTLFILIAPAAVGFIAYVKLTGEVDGFARVLYYFGLFTFLLLMTLIGRFLKLPFFVSWWAYTFPLAALTISTLLLYAQTKLPIFQAMAYTFLLLTSVVIVAVLLRTLWAGVKGEICVPE